MHKTTVLRWMLGLVLSLWPVAYGWIAQKVRSGIVYADEKWIKLRRIHTIRGKWHYWLVVLDQATQLPFHHQRGVSSWLKEHFPNTEDLNQRKQAMRKVLQRRDKRTVRRRLDKLRRQAAAWGIVGWVEQTMDSLTHLLPAVGSRVLPTTTNAIERFFRTFHRFYKVRCGFHSVRSARLELLLFLLVYVFTQRAQDGKAPIETIVPEASQMPFYRLINDPFAFLESASDVKQTSAMAHEMPYKLLAA